MISDFVSHSKKHSYFDRVIGALEDVIISHEFTEAQQSFLDQYCEAFDETDENKLEYTDIFKKYETLGEQLLIAGLKDRMGGDFDFGKFRQELDKNKTDELYEITEMLDCFCDFLSFKQLMVDHKRAKRGDTMALDACLIGRWFQFSNEFAFFDQFFTFLINGLF